ncbi:transaldolase family protein [Cellulosimicrobium cellulans]|uniref:Fructose-6-phosphate aldolase n=1 Tax=Cellulosimicrobium cellulans TaxID=1710 RepID=A0A4Y4DTN3_CELCE|nr:transaldolase family protein [Cellulosimicrobium cellulans]GED08043.1 fructose-6-phosphate aldolase [Cellulosimicrobium cellulans]
MLYIDSADRDQVERLLATGLFAGVTTNPTILYRSGLTVDDVPAVHRWARAAGAGTVFLQAVGPDEAALEAHSRELVALGPDVVVKLPATRDGLTVSRRLTREGVPVLVTAVYHASQALLADAAGAGWVAPYVGRMGDLGLDGVEQTADLHATLRRVRASGDGGCRVLAASLRDTTQVAALAARGIEDFTLSTQLCGQLLDETNSVAAAAQFEVDAHAAR